mgnify:CR=1 FL=1
MNKEEYFLLRKLNEGDISVMEVIYFRYAPQIKAFVSAILKDPADTEDLVQDIFLKIWDDRETVCHAKSFRSYLFTMTRNIVYNHLKKKKVHDRFMDYTKNSSSSYNPEQRIITKDLLGHIDNEMKKLTDRQRTIYELNRNDDFTYSEIAEKLGLSPKTIQYHIGTVLSRFKKILS